MIHWGILGAGNIARRFAKSLQYDKDSVLYAISGRSQEKLDAFRAQFPCEKTYVGHENMLADGSVDAIYLALPHGLHAEWAVKALEKGIAVLCEKPAALNEEEMRRIAACAKEHNTLFMEAMKPRFVPAYARLKETLEAGVIGEVTHVYTKICFELPKEAAGRSYHTSGRDGGALLDSGIYCASMIEDLLTGEPDFMQTYANCHDGVDYYTDSEMRFENGGARMEVAFDRSAPRNAEITGTRGSVTVIDLHRPQTFIIHTAEGDTEVTVPYENDDFWSEIAHFTSLVREGKTESPVHPYAAMIREAHILDRIRSQYTEYGEADLSVLETQEKDLAFDSFDNADALRLGCCIAETALSYDRPVSVQITRCADDLTVFRYMAEGKTETNIRYMEGKKKCTEDTGHSSAWVYVKTKTGEPLSFRQSDGVHVISGGAFPLYIGETMAYIVQVSGLHEGKDHELIVRSIEKMSGKETVPFRKALG